MNKKMKSEICNLVELNCKEFETIGIENKGGNKRNARLEETKEGREFNVKRKMTKEGRNQSEAKTLLD